MSIIQFTECPHDIPLVEVCFICRQIEQEEKEALEEEIEDEMRFSISQEMRIDEEIDREILRRNGYDS